MMPLKPLLRVFRRCALGFLLVLTQVQCAEKAAGLEADNSLSAVTSGEAPFPIPLDTIPTPTDDWRDLFHPRYLTGRFTADDHPDMVAVPPEMTDGDGTYHLHREALAAFREMRAAAAQDSVRLVIISAFRNFDRQKSIWEAKWRGERLLEGREKADEAFPNPADRALAILRYSSMPGSSRHHWGTDMDLNRLNNEYFESGEGARIYNWLRENAADYGFCQPYSPLGEDRPHGYQEERWHWSYFPLSRRLTAFAEAHLRYESITDFAGSEVASEIEVIPRYVLGVNADCQ